MVSDSGTMLVILTLAAVGLLLGARCSPCCGCTVPDGKPRTDPANEGTWSPSGTWPDVTWTFTENPGNDAGNTWFFYGSPQTSGDGGESNWFNLCNWYSHKTTAPNSISNLPAVLTKRAFRFPPENAVVHVYSGVAAPFSSQNVSVKSIYFWGVSSLTGSGGETQELTATDPAHDTPYGFVFSCSNNSYGTLFPVTLNGGARFQKGSANTNATINGGASFHTDSYSLEATINDGAYFYNDSLCGQYTVVNGGAELYDLSTAWFDSVINDGAVFYDDALTYGTVNGGAVFNDNSTNGGNIFGGATFNDTACTLWTKFVGGVRIFVSNQTGADDIPTCNGTAPQGSDPTATCGCG